MKCKKYRIALIIVCVLGGLVLSACGKTDEVSQGDMENAGAVNQGTESREQVEIVETEGLTRRKEVVICF